MITSFFGVTPFKSDGMGEVFTPDTTKFVEIPKVYKTDPRYHLKYTIKDTDRPDEMAYRIYGDASLYWLILSMNDMWPYHEKWPMNDQQMQEYLQTKYPYSEEGDILFYLDVNGNVINSLHPAIRFGSTPEAVALIQQYTPVTIAQFENGLNEQKRQIKILDPDYVSDVKGVLKKVTK